MKTQKEITEIFAKKQQKQSTAEQEIQGQKKQDKQEKQSQKQYCMISNLCAKHKYLCCHFCQNSTCEMRCKDLDHNKKCIYSTDVNRATVLLQRQQETFAACEQNITTQTQSAAKSAARRAKKEADLQSEVEQRKQKIAAEQSQQK